MESHTNQNAQPKGRPLDYAFRYEFHSGRVPAASNPPASDPSDDYYEFVIEIAPDGSGEIHFRRDKEVNRPEEFVAIFTPEEADLERVYRLMLAAGFFEPFWQPPRRKDRPASSTARLEVTCGGSGFEITPARFDALEDFGQSLHEAIRALVPQAIWDKIEKFQRPA